MWSVWHWPYITYLTVSTAVLPGDTPPELVVVALAIATIQTLFLHAVTTAGIAVIYTWFYNNTESVLIAILFHMTTNVVMAYLQSSPVLSIITGIMPWVIAIFLFKRYGEETLTGNGTGGENPEIEPIPVNS